MKSIEMARFVVAQADEGLTSPSVAQELDLELTEELHEEVGVAEDHQDSGMPQLATETYASQLFWLALCFVVLYLIMSRAALPRIATAIENRRDRIASDLDTAARLKEETDEVIATYEAELAQARAKANQIAGDTRDRINQQLAEERGEVEERMAERTAAAEKHVAEVKARALAEVDSAAIDATSEIVDLLIGNRPTEAEAAAAVKAVRS
ncbi:F0F1 ATP synthase subunit B [Lutibaculum baratangense]|uniref:ATP synthase subunit b n=1 Tax=Lutibaculum baratangense AMV1 TaxID=631454 RepID=V4TK05_9HYPH|nr:F0F1 ATP synthase subunit B [Lutibaculum baratangense]ESR26223.1 ATP synthase F0 sector subunit b' [Lutibaculum baratangense AMV1]